MIWFYKLVYSRFYKHKGNIKHIDLVLIFVHDIALTYKSFCNQSSVTEKVV